MIYASEYGARWNLLSPTLIPEAAGSLWNRQRHLRAFCRGYVQSERLGEPGGEAPAPRLARFVYLRDDRSGDIYSAPYEPVRRTPELFNFSVGQNDILWDACFDGIDVRLQLLLPEDEDEELELWSITLSNRSQASRPLSVYPYFALDATSPLHQAAQYRPDLEGIVAHSVQPPGRGQWMPAPPLQQTFLLHERTPLAWQVQADAFAGEGGLHHPDALARTELQCDDARQEDAVAVLQYRLTLEPGQSETFRLMAGRARDRHAILALRRRYLSASGFSRTLAAGRAASADRRGSIHVDTPDEEFNHFVNHWLVRQMHGGADASERDEAPATRDYLQDHLGVVFTQPARARVGFLHALAQQKESGAMPVSLRRNLDEPLPAIGQPCQSDDCLWLTVFLRAYLDETDDYTLLHEALEDTSGRTQSVFERVNRAMHWVMQSRDFRGLCDLADSSLASLGSHGVTISATQSLMTVYAFRCWADICEHQLLDSLARQYRQAAQELAAAADRHLWDGDWYVRGLTGGGLSLGSRRDTEGRIYLTPQCWALLANTGNELQRRKIIGAVEEHLLTPHGVMNLAPCYQQPSEKAGAHSLWHPGTGENGSLHSHSAACYAHSLYRAGEAERGYQVLRTLIPAAEAEAAGARQLPTVLPAWRFGAWESFPGRTGRASITSGQDAASWLYRTIIEDLFGLRGSREGLSITPQLPSHWGGAKLVRYFRGATIYITLEREQHVTGTHITLDGEPLEDDGIIRNLQAGKRYQVEVIVGRPALSPAAEALLRESEKKRA